MTNRPVSIQDIAKVAGVSHSTVSRALRDSPLISLEVRQRIQRLAQEMGYTPNQVAQSLKERRTNTVGVVITSISDPFLARVVLGIEEVAQAAGIQVLLSISDNDPQREIQLIDSFHRRRVDGVISSTARIDETHLRRLVKMGIPTVLINQAVPGDAPLVRAVQVDDYASAMQAVRYLLSLGHRAIGYLGAGNRPRSNWLRLSGYRDALRMAGVSANESWIRVAPAEHRYYAEDVADGQAMLEALLPTGITAVFCYNDTVAVGALLACHQLGIAVPEQLSIVGFDDVELAQYVTPPLTTVHQPKLRLGRRAMEMLLELVEEKPVQNEVLPTDLVVRRSTAPAPKTAPAMERRPREER
ncbi:MAG: LacI family transcriptional regulator [Caldilineales bacterium]|nr:LacI family transcriptional regulator [Caldilineales bacterium]MDW8316710.1 LacI family DNA-binding transcriptional regulator [Anaerolineae bacterium]